MTSSVSPTPTTSGTQITYQTSDNSYLDLYVHVHVYGVYAHHEGAHFLRKLLPWLLCWYNAYGQSSSKIDDMLQVHVYCECPTTWCTKWTLVLVLQVCWGKSQWCHLLLHRWIIMCACLIYWSLWSHSLCQLYWLQDFNSVSIHCL